MIYEISEIYKKGDAIGFVAPSFGCDTEPYKTAFAERRRTTRKYGFGYV